MEQPPFSVFLLFPFTILYCSFYACYILTSRHGEYLADARARVMIPDLELLNSKMGQDVIYYFLELMQINITSEEKRDAKRTIGWLRSHPSAQERDIAIREKIYLSENRATVMDWSAILVGIWSAIIYFMSLLFFSPFGHRFMLFSTLFEREIPIKNQLISDIAGTLLIYIVLLFSVIFFLLPVRNAISQASQNFLSFIGQVCTKTVILALAFISTHLVTGIYIIAYILISNPPLSLSNPPANLMDILLNLHLILRNMISTYYFVFGTYGVVLLLTPLALTLIRENEIISKELLQPLQLIHFIGAATAVVSFIIILLIFVNVQWISIATSVTIGITLIVPLLNLNVFLNNNHYICRSYNLSIIRIDTIRSKLSKKVASGVTGILFAVVIVIIPMLIAFFPTGWFIKREPIPGTTLLFVGLVFFSIRSSKKYTEPVLLYYKFHVYKELLGLIDESNTYIYSALHQLKKTIGRKGGYRSIAYPLNFSSTMETIRSVALIFWNLFEIFIQEAIDWILKKESNRGGFSVIEDVAPELDATFFAIQTLYETNQLGLIKYPDKHIEFILKHQSEIGGFTPTDMKTSTLEATYHAIASLNMLNSANTVIQNRERCADWIFSEWKKGEKSSRFNFEETYYLVYCLQWLDAFDKEKKNTILKQWLPTHRIVMRHLRPDTNDEKVYYYIKVLDLLGQREDDYSLHVIKEALTKNMQSGSPTLTWEGHLIEIKIRYSGEYFWLATESVVLVDGEEIARSGGFSTKELATGEFMHNEQPCILELQVNSGFPSFKYVLLINDMPVGQGKIDPENGIVRLIWIAVLILIALLLSR